MACFGKSNECSYRSAKFGFVSLLFMMTIIAIGFRLHDADPFHGKTADLAKGCSSQEGTCESYQAVYRASFASFIFFLLMMFSCSVCDILHRFFWPVKVISLLGLTVCFFFVGNDVFSVYKEIARVLSGIYLVFQIIVLVNLAYHIHDTMISNMARYEENNDPQMHSCWKYGYIILCFFLLASSLTGIILLYIYYNECDINTGFITVTLILSVISIFLSLLENAGVGLLPPSVVVAYCVYLCWQALLSYPSSKCNPTVDSHGNLTSWSIILSLIATAITLVWTGYSTSRSLIDMSAPQPEDNQPQMSNRLKNILETGETKKSVDSVENVDTENSDKNQLTEKENDPHSEFLWIFHAVMLLASAYMAMVLTNWGEISGDSSTSPSVGKESMYLKIASQWLTFIIFLSTIILPLVRG